MKYSLSRYERHMDLPNFGAEGQDKLKNAKVCIVGAGGLGCPVALYLSAAGVGNISLVDADTVSLTNLQRQILYSVADVGGSKVDAARSRIESLNPELKLDVKQVRISEDNCKDIFFDHDIIVDCSDNFDTRYLVNAISRQLDITLVSGAVIQYDGQVFVFKKGTPCYACLFPTKPSSVAAPTCTESAILGPVAGVVGTLMSIEVIKEICGLGQSLAGHFLAYSSLSSSCDRIKFSAQPHCPVCSVA